MGAGRSTQKDDGNCCKKLTSLDFVFIDNGDFKEDVVSTFLMHSWKFQLDMWAL